MKKKSHLLQISDLTLTDIEAIFNLSMHYLHNTNFSDILKNKIIINLFFEYSTRTLSSFEIAEKSLGATTITVNIATSSINKGESIIDTISTLQAMNPNLMIIRSQYSTFIHTLAKIINNCCIINAGDGNHEHPTQALIDYCTIRYLKGSLQNLNISICGDILHSRVARSNVKLLSQFNTNITLIGPPNITCKLQGVSRITHNLIEGIQDADIIMLLRIQKERMIDNIVPSLKDYSHLYLLNKEKLAYTKPNVIIMHPGPANKGVEISNNVADKHSVILLQVKMGVAVRKAILHYLLSY
ncbi:aspartate carbamoyltransferase catalytic subunit [Neoehrlichia mikurensis]|uniref:Aspartate carbamoyltransferase n=1 Tax=Neoehrlichia mikurensis TaxID=89586 RepID=A0A9Q9BS38_9RICK|nr:aspartate carbamoyltransferase catalytic subunit [Neoehrlichia mikurensis]QXK91917.1 aspartate carbamoyltransferase catalytic subunit [Neoehrlichia mikurensis]UTO55435.1 aspartate carbamoyltransferase catalytic subunit [Neoehrlichia mikurensis]